jgi:predicted amidohydrolase YtcJ
MTPDLLILNAAVLTMDAARPAARAVAVTGGRISAVGGEELARLAGPETRVIDGRGRTLMPGFFESHMHLVLGGAELAHLQLGGVEAGEALARAIRTFATTYPDRPLLMAQGAGYDLTRGGTPRAVLDAILPDRPFAMCAADHHTVWANSAALSAAGLIHGAPMPHGHEVVMGPDGLATGELREFEAFAPVIALGGEAHLNLGIATGREPAPWPDAAQQAIDRQKVLNGLHHCARHGITSIVNMDGNRYTLDLLAGLRAEGNLIARVKVPFHMKPDMDLAELDRASGMTADFADDWLSSGMVKMFMDGVVDSGTAYLTTDYAGFPGQRGAPLFDPAAFAAIVIAAERQGLQIAVHCVGDGAVNATLNGYAAARAAHGPRDLRHRIEHIEMILPSDIPRLAALGVTASLQPSHPPGAMDFPLQPTMDVIGRARWPDCYLWGTLADAGAHVAFASDWPVTDVSVLRNIGAALTRVPFDGCADERLGLMPTLRAYTAGGAWAAHREGVTGTLRPGLAGDLVLLSGDITATAPDQVAAMAVDLTVAGGRITWDAPARATA